MHCIARLSANAGSQIGLAISLIVIVVLLMLPLVGYKPYCTVRLYEVQVIILVSHLYPVIVEDNYVYIDMFGERLLMPLLHVLRFVRLQMLLTWTFLLSRMNQN